jgi:hypothetical protein
MKKEIVKVQISINGNRKEKRVLTYNHDRSIEYECPLSEEVAGVMNNEWKKYFYFTRKYHGKGFVIALDDEAPEQDW